MEVVRIMAVVLHLEVHHFVRVRQCDIPGNADSQYDYYEHLKP